MADLARRPLDASQAPHQNRSPNAEQELPLPVQVGLPASLRADVADALPGPLSVMAAELGFARVPDMTVRRSARLTVAICGRPIGDFSDNSVTSTILMRTLRRLPLLAGPEIDRRGTAAYLTSVGCRKPEDTSTDRFDVEEAERLIDRRDNDQIVLEVPSATMRRTGEPDVRAVLRLREDEFREWGVVYPDVRLVLTDARPGTVRMRLNDVTLPARNLGEDAAWRDVVGCLAGELRARRHWFVRMSDMVRVLDEDLAYSYPDLVAVAEANYSRAQVTACVRELLRSGRRARNLLRILWLLIEAGGSAAGPDVLRMSESPLLPKARRRPSAERDPILQAVRIRKLAAEEDWRTGTYQRPRQAVRLTPEIEERLVREHDVEALAVAEWAAVRAVTAHPGAQRVYTHTVDALGPVRDALQAVGETPKVRTSHELPPDADVDALPILTDPL